MNRKRRDYRDSSGTKPTVLFPLSEIWTPVEVEVSWEVEKEHGLPD